MKSMTGYASAQKECDWGSLVVEMKAVNGRYADIILKTNRELNSYEEKIKKLLLQTIKRGRVTVHIFCDRSAHVAELDMVVNKELAFKSHALVQDLLRTLDLQQELPLAQYPQFRDFFQIDGIDDQLLIPYEDMAEVVSQALDIFDQSRRGEGKDLEKDLLQRIAIVEPLSKVIETMVDRVKVQHRERLEKNMREVLRKHSIEEGRLLTEIGAFADRVDISEELTRFESHLKHFKEALNSEDVLGRRLDFILQELHREVNTMSNKCSDFDISELAVDIKCELEKMREQVQNIE